jgi:iron complex transport system substrate-binding protein
MSCSIRMTCFKSLTGWIPLAKNQGRFWLTAAVLLNSLVAQAVVLTDERGQRVDFAQPPQRIVSLLPSLTEMVCDLGQCQRLVGVDRYSNFPAQVKRVPQVGGGLDPQIEAIVALKPDVVLLATSSPAIARLESLGLKVLALEPKRHADVRLTLDVLGMLLAVPDAQRVWRKIDTQLNAVAASLPARAKPLRIYFEVNSAPYAAGEASFIGETLTRLGVANIVPANLGPFPKLNPEFVVRANPDVILLGDTNFEGMAQRPGWAGMSALRAKRICVFTPEQSDMMVRPGPRMSEAALLIAQCLKDKAP